ncbi:MAG: DUF559 domain-containing protein [Ruminococcus sp.]|nr:DUF559 domain-containing protein [Ruminococcus sp.]
MERKYNKKLIPTAQLLRKSMTKEECHLWYDFLRNYPVKFTRQKVLGQCIADFYCAKARLIIELDGSHHFGEDDFEHDIERNKYLEQFGLTVLHIPNNEINHNFNAVCDYIDFLVNRVIDSE